MNTGDLSVVHVRSLGNLPNPSLDTRGRVQPMTLGTQGTLLDRMWSSQVEFRPPKTKGSWDELRVLQSSGESRRTTGPIFLEPTWSKGVTSKSKTGLSESRSPNRVGTATEGPFSPSSSEPTRPTGTPDRPPPSAQERKRRTPSTLHPRT